MSSAGKHFVFITCGGGTLSVGTELERPFRRRSEANDAHTPVLFIHLSNLYAGSEEFPIDRHVTAVWAFYDVELLLLF